MALTVVKNPTAVFVQNSWGANLGMGTEVAVVTDASDATLMGGVEAAFEDLGYHFEDIDDAPGSRITSCIVTHRVLHPVFGAILFPRAWFGSSSYAGLPFETGAPTPVFETRTHDWINELTSHGGTVGIFNSARFGCHANWISQPPGLAKLSVTVTYQPAEGGFTFLLASLGPLVALGCEHMSSIVRHLAATRQAWFPAADYARALTEYRALKWPTYFFF